MAAAAHTGYITDVDAQRLTCSVSTAEGYSYLQVPLPTIPGVQAVPEVGAAVHVLVDARGNASISYSGAKAPSRPSTQVPHPGASSDPAPALSRGTTQAFVESGPDMSSIMSRTGRSVASVDDRGVYLRSGGTSAELHRSRQLARVVATNLEMFLGGGSITSMTREGANVLRLTYAAQCADGSDPQVEQWDVEVEVGDCADGSVLCTRVLGPDGSARFESSVSHLGQASVSASEFLLMASDLLSFEAQRVEVACNGLRVVSGSEAFVRAASVTTESTGNTAIRSAGRVTVSAGSSMDVQATGSVQFLTNGSLLPTPLTEAFVVDAVNGTIRLTAGNPALGDLGSARSSVRIETITGDVRIWAPLGGVSIDTTVPGGVKLGGPPLGLPPAPALPGPFAGTLFEPLYAWAQAFGAGVDAHVHASFPSGGPTTPPIVPIYAPTSPLLVVARSIFVTFGG